MWSHSPYLSLSLFLALSRHFFFTGDLEFFGLGSLFASPFSKRSLEFAFIVYRGSDRTEKIVYEHKYCIGIKFVVDSRAAISSFSLFFNWFAEKLLPKMLRFVSGENETKKGAKSSRSTPFARFVAFSPVSFCLLRRSKYKWPTNTPPCMRHIRSTRSAGSDAGCDCGCGVAVDCTCVAVCVCALCTLRGGVSVMCVLSLSRTAAVNAAAFDFALLLVLPLLCAAFTLQYPLHWEYHKLARNQDKVSHA